jgi:hypothetical protein
MGMEGVGGDVKEDQGKPGAEGRVSMTMTK